MVHLQCWLWTLHVPKTAPKRVEQHVSRALQLTFIMEPLLSIKQKLHCRTEGPQKSLPSVPLPASPGS